MPLSASETLLHHPSRCHKAKRVHNLFLCRQVRRWIKSPMVSVEKHPHASLKYPASTVMHLPPGDSELEPSLCQTCLSDHPFQRGIAPQEAESCSWESQRSSKVSRSFLPHTLFTCFTLITGLYLRDCASLGERAFSKIQNSADQGCCAHLGSAFYLELWYPWTAWGAKGSSQKCCDVVSQYLNRSVVTLRSISLFYRN